MFCSRHTFLWPYMVYWTLDGSAWHHNYHGYTTPTLASNEIKYLSTLLIISPAIQPQSSTRYIFVKHFGPHLNLNTTLVTTLHYTTIGRMQVFPNFCAVFNLNHIHIVMHLLGTWNHFQSLIAFQMYGGL